MAEPAATTFKERDKILERYVAHQTVISHVQPLHTGRAFFSADWNGVLHAWLAYTADDQQGSFDKNLFGGRFFGDVGSFMTASRAPDRGITSIGLSHNGRRLALGTDDGYVEIWEVRGFEMIARAQTHTGRVIGTSLNADGSKVVSVGRDGKIIAQNIIADPQYGIAALATRSKLAPFFVEEMLSARKVQFLASGAVILTTDQGQLGEVSLSGQSPVAIPTPQQTAAPVSKMDDSDY
jgi:WD40 repeat protein